MTRAIWWLIGFVAGLCAFGILISCAGARQDEAGITYTGALLACVDRAQTLAESKACRRTVDAKWALDAGADGGDR